MRAFILILLISLAFSNQLELDTTKSMTLDQAVCLKTDLYTCEIDIKYFEYAIVELTKWVEVIENRSTLEHDILMLKSVYKLVEKAKFDQPNFF